MKQIYLTLTFWENCKTWSWSQGFSDCCDLSCFPFISCLYVTIMCNYCKVSDDSPPSRAISHDQVNQDLVNDIGRPILSNFLMVSLTGLNIIWSWKWSWKWTRISLMMLEDQFFLIFWWWIWPVQNLNNVLLLNIIWSWKWTRILF